MKCRLLLLLLAGLLLAGCSCGGSTPIPATDTGSAAATVAIPAGTAPVVPAVDPGKLTVATFNLMFLG
ncbi:MAG TPA: hypothetical protein PKM88_14990, partial [bacterium]|nr:hypothetical protein [bacterium]